MLEYITVSDFKYTSENVYQYVDVRKNPVVILVHSFGLNILYEARIPLPHFSTAFSKP